MSNSPVTPRTAAQQVVIVLPAVVKPPVEVPPDLEAADLDALEGAFSVRPGPNGFVVRCGGQLLGEVTLHAGPRFVLARAGLAPVEITQDGSRRLLSLLVNAQWGNRWSRR